MPRLLLSCFNFRWRRCNSLSVARYQWYFEGLEPLRWAPVLLTGHEADAVWRVIEWENIPHSITGQSFETLASARSHWLTTKSYGWQFCVCVIIRSGSFSYRTLAVAVTTIDTCPSAYFRPLLRTSRVVQLSVLVRGCSLLLVDNVTIAVKNLARFISTAFEVSKLSQYVGVNFPSFLSSSDSVQGLMWRWSLGVCSVAGQTLP